MAYRPEWKGVDESLTVRKTDLFILGLLLYMLIVLRKKRP